MLELVAHVFKTGFTFKSFCLKTEEILYKLQFYFLFVT